MLQTLSSHLLNNKTQNTEKLYSDHWAQIQRTEYSNGLVELQTELAATVEMCGGSFYSKHR
jgi:hypothetical protein